MYYNKKGYVGNKMSIRAVEAYNNDEMPMSKWTKQEMLSSVNYNFEEEQL